MKSLRLTVIGKRENREGAYRHRNNSKSVRDVVEKEEEGRSGRRAQAYEEGWTDSQQVWGGVGKDSQGERRWGGGHEA